MNKKIITEIVVKELPDDHPDKSISIDKLFLRYWYTGRHSNVLRLTSYGYEAFIVAGLQEYTYAFNLSTLLDKLNNIRASQLTIKIGKLLNCPWYLAITKTHQHSLDLRIFDSKVAMMINLYGGIEDYLKLKL